MLNSGITHMFQLGGQPIQDHGKRRHRNFIGGAVSGSDKTYLYAVGAHFALAGVNSEGVVIGGDCGKEIRRIRAKVGGRVKNRDGNEIGSGIGFNERNAAAVSQALIGFIEPISAGAQVGTFEWIFVVNDEQIMSLRREE